MSNLKCYALSDIGLTRKENEDSYCASQSQGLFLVADGMGGHAAGKLASRMAVATIESFINQVRDGENISWPYKIDHNLSTDNNKLITAIRLANEKIYKTSQGENNCRGMGSTVVATLVNKNQASIANVGDSRAYLIRDNAIRQLTRDHSWVDQQVKLGRISLEDAKNHKLKNVITRALGADEDVEVDIHNLTVEKGDYLLICSDGLSNFVSDEDMSRNVLSAKQDISLSCHNLIEAAKNNGSNDNITLIVVYFE